MRPTLALACLILLVGCSSEHELRVALEDAHAARDEALAARQEAERARAAAAAAVDRARREAEQAAANASPDAWPEADPADVASIDALMTALYDVISGPAGQPRDWDRMASLFHPTQGRLTAVGPRADGGVGALAMSPAEYRARAAPLFERQGFVEAELARVEERFGPMAHVFSTYETRESADSDVLQRGINSLQLLFDGERWSILSIAWSAESPAQPIPARYLP